MTADTLEPYRISASDMEAFGIAPGWTFGAKVRVRWSDLDAFGHANHKSHLTWFEDIRNSYLQAGGYPIRNAAHPGPVLRNITCSYEKSAELDQQLMVTAKTDWIGRTSFGMSYATWHDGLVAHGTAVCIWHVNQTRRSEPVPATLRAFMLALDNAADKLAVENSGAGQQS